MIDGLREIWLDNTIRRESWLAVLNFITALLCALLFPYLTLSTLFAYSMSAPVPPITPLHYAESLVWRLPLLGLPVLDAFLCLGLLAAVGLWNGEPWGRRLTLFLIGFITFFVLSVFSFFIVGILLTLLNGSKVPLPFLKTFALLLIPALAYAVLGLLLLRPQREVPLTVEQVLAWADRHHALTGLWPRADDGAIAEVSGENWGDLDRAFKQGRRGFPGGESLAEFIQRYRRSS
jgi:hypothetical protein